MAMAACEEKSASSSRSSSVGSTRPGVSMTSAPTGPRWTTRGAALHGLDGCLDGPVRGHDEHGQPWLALVQRLHELDAVERQHAQVEQGDVEPVSGGELHRLVRLGRRGDVEAHGGQPHLEHLEDRRVVVYDENSPLHVMELQIGVNRGWPVRGAQWLRTPCRAIESTTTPGRGAGRFIYRFRSSLRSVCLIVSRSARRRSTSCRRRVISLSRSKRSERSLAISSRAARMADAVSRRACTDPASRSSGYFFKNSSYAAMADT